MPIDQPGPGHPARGLRLVLGLSAEPTELLRRISHAPSLLCLVLELPTASPSRAHALMDATSLFPSFWGQAIRVRREFAKPAFPQLDFRPPCREHRDLVCPRAVSFERAGGFNTITFCVLSESKQLS